MKSNHYILAIDQGTSSTKTIIFNKNGEALYKATEPLHTMYLEGNKVEQDPEEIYQNVLASVRKCLEGFKENGGDIDQIVSCGISNQRETFVLWDNEGVPLHNAVVWQCKRSIEICQNLKEKGLESEINKKTGLIIDPYFSGTKVIWLKENDEKINKAIENGEAYFGNVDTWLLYKLTGGKSYYTDYTNASRTLFFNLHTLEWDSELLEKFSLTSLNLPELRPSASHFGATDFEGLLNHKIPMSAMIGDSHAAAFGEGCFESGQAKATLGTGSSILMNIGNQPKISKNGMVTTICWSIENRVDYALEGIIVSAGATLEWLRKQVELFDDPSVLEEICLSLKDNGGVYLIPAFSGLGAPHWDMSRKASIVGLTFDSTREHIIRAGVESIPYQIKDVIEAMVGDAEIDLTELKIDGGITKNQFVVQFLADLLGRKISKVEMHDVSALGAGLLAGLSSGIFKDLSEIRTLLEQGGITLPNVSSTEVDLYYQEWLKWIRN